MNIHPLNKIKIAGTVVAIAVVALVVGINKPDVSFASTTDNVRGFLWSDMPNQSDQNLESPSNPCNSPSNSGRGPCSGRGLGWISVNSDGLQENGAPSSPSAASGIPYGVSLDLTSGVFSGQGWSEYGGWVEFNPSGAKPNALGNSAISAKLDGPCLSNPVFSSCPVLGWIKFSAGGTPQSGGWDGWVSLQGINPNYGVNYNKSTKEFSGYAWGGMVAGWIDFSGMSVVTTDSTCLGADGVMHTYSIILPPICVITPLQICRDDSTNPPTVYTYRITDPIPAACTQLSCSSGGTTYWYPLGGPVPSQCGGPTYVTCKDSAGNEYQYLQGTTRPSQCTRDSDLCPAIRGDQGENGPWTDPDSGYLWGLVGSVCIQDQCIDTNPGDPETDGFTPRVPTGYQRDPSTGICRPQIPCGTPGGPACPTSGGIDPDYKDN